MTSIGPFPLGFGQRKTPSKCEFILFSAEISPDHDWRFRTVNRLAHWSFFLVRVLVLLFSMVYVCFFL
ncbi:hypothetical protein K469DRAFT_713902 [Zopfia rhizophila CBS 207.26]|uniref:Uncharacterized protein n=1 Tax=Zopfia rhizophila CBS 207.26 TaxID=1314779 RepID=A0A6A6DTQ4_9PEZI|nr:hypothetical protein K469DRAFT_713902 [Zopfia rhizophila CBS 207.26]